MRLNNKLASPDEILYRKLMNTARFLGVVPFTTKKSCSSKLNVLLLMLAYVLVETWQVVYRTLRHLDHTGLVHVADIFYYINENMVMVCVFSACLANEKNWSKFFHRMDTIMELTEEVEATGVFDKFSLYVPVCLYVCFVVNEVFQVAFFIYSLKAFTPYIMFNVANIYILYTCVLFSKIIHIIEKFQRNFSADFLLLNENKLFICDVLVKTFKSKITLISSIVSNINVLFGWKVLSIFVGYTITIINCITVIFFFDQNWSWGFRTKVFTLGDMFRVLVYSINVLMVIEKCNSIKKQNEKFILNCYYMQEDMPNSRISNELLQLAKYADKLAPKCSAAGFFTVNRLIVKAIFSTITSYLIVCLQFNLGNY